MKWAYSFRNDVLIVSATIRHYSVLKRQVAPDVSYISSSVHRKKQHASSIRTIPSKNIAFIQVFFLDSGNSMQYRSMLLLYPIHVERIVESFEHK